METEEQDLPLHQLLWRLPLALLVVLVVLLVLLPLLLLGILKTIPMLPLTWPRRVGTARRRS